MEIQTVTPKTETEFNSSVATLRRIDDLMRQLHDLSRGIIPTNKFGIPLITGNPHELYLKTIKRLYLEGKEKFDKTEKDKIAELKKSIDDVRGEYGINLSRKTIVKGMPPHNYENKLYYESWNKILEANEEYEEYIVGCLDKHGMLITTKKDSDEEPDDWGEDE